MQRTYVLIPGAGGTAQYWYRIAPILTDAGHHVAPLDLPNWPGATLADQAEAIVAAGAGADAVVLVSQSMGGFSAPLACDRLPISHLFLVNAMIPVPGETPGQWWDNTGQSEAVRSHDVTEGRNPDAGFDLYTYFLHDLPPDVIEKITSGGDQEPADSLFSSVYDLRRWPDVPTTVLAARDDRFFPYEFQHRVARERLGLIAEQIAGGHLCALSQPEGLAQRLLR
ncbi:MAG: alpha/beta hydrolase [Propionibacteriaceae bacterium]|nr:alpha/beta hydrolase [Propionibacteriaceae bacterium]